MDNELDTMNDRPFDPFRVTEKDKKLFTDVIKPYWKNKSVFEKWLKRIPDSVAGLRDNAIIYIDRKAVRGPGELTPGFDWLLEDGISGIQKWVEELLEQSELSAPNGYERQTYLRSLLISCEGILTLAARYAKEARRLAALQKIRKEKRNWKRSHRYVTGCRPIRPRHSEKLFNRFICTISAYLWNRTRHLTIRGVWTSICTRFTRKTRLRGG